MRRQPENERYYVHEIVKWLEWHAANSRPDQKEFQVVNEIFCQHDAVPKEWTYPNWIFCMYSPNTNIHASALVIVF